MLRCAEKEASLDIYVADSAGLHHRFLLQPPILNPSCPSLPTDDISLASLHSSILVVYFIASSSTFFFDCIVSRLSWCGDFSNTSSFTSTTAQERERSLVFRCFINRPDIRSRLRTRLFDFWFSHAQNKYCGVDAVELPRWSRNTFIPRARSTADQRVTAVPFQLCSLPFE